MGAALPALLFRFERGRVALRRRCRFEVRRLAVIYQRQLVSSPASGKGRIKTRAILARVDHVGWLVAGPPSTSSQGARDRPNAVVRSVRVAGRIGGAGE